MYGDYTKLGDEWDNFTIDSVSVLPKGVAPEAVYNVDTTFLSDVRMTCDVKCYLCVLLGSDIFVVILFVITKTLFSKAL